MVLPDGNCCVPVPRLLVHRITKGIYYDLLNKYPLGKGNQFADWFGLAFQEYGGWLLKNGLSQGSVFPEPAYGKPEKRGADWTVIQGKNALVMEFKSGRLPKLVKAKADYEEMAHHVKRTIADAVSKLPAKIGDLQKGITGIDTSLVTQYVPTVVTLEPWYPEALTVEFVGQMVGAENMPENFRLLSIADVELLLAWADQTEPADLLLEQSAT
jgi:hypothetical protein